MTVDSALERALDEPTAMTALFVLGLGFLTMFAGVSWFWMIFVFGFAVVVPLVALLYEDREDEGATTEEDQNEPTENPLETLRDRYVRDELTNSRTNSSNANSTDCSKPNLSAEPNTANENVSALGSSRRRRRSNRQKRC